MFPWHRSAAYEDSGWEAPQSSPMMCHHNQLRHPYLYPQHAGSLYDEGDLVSHVQQRGAPATRCSTPSLSTKEQPSDDHLHASTDSDDERQSAFLDDAPRTAPRAPKKPIQYARRKLSPSTTTDSNAASLHGLPQSSLMTLAQQEDESSLSQRTADRIMKLVMDDDGENEKITPPRNAAGRQLMAAVSGVQETLEALTLAASPLSKRLQFEDAVESVARQFAKSRRSRREDDTGGAMLTSVSGRRQRERSFSSHESPQRGTWSCSGGVPDVVTPASGCRGIGPRSTIALPCFRQCAEEGTHVADRRSGSVFWEKQVNTPEAPPRMKRRVEPFHPSPLA